MRVWALASEMEGTALLRIEDTDSTRCRPEFETAVLDDLSWIGLHWPEPVRRQSDHYPEYWQTLDRLAELGVLYPCSCNRRAIQAAGAKPGSDGLVYPGTCRLRSMNDMQIGDAIRMDVQKALALVPQPLHFEDLEYGTTEISRAQLTDDLGDPVLRRKETWDPAYHLACTHDDAVQNVTHVVRGEDVRSLTPIHVLLQRLMDWPTPVYLHHPLITDEDGKRLAKITHSKAIATYRAEGATPNDIRRLVGLPKV